MESSGNASGIIGIIITLIGLAVSVHHFSRSYRAAAKVKLIDWLSNMAKDFHADKDYVETRLMLATQRVEVRRQFALEFLYDGWTIQQLAAAGMLTTDDEAAIRGLKLSDQSLVFGQLRWELLKNVTDYLYFFERLLMQGESLASQGFCADAQLLVDHFGWFMRSLLCQWSGPLAENNDTTFEDRWRARKLFVVYLAENRYRRLAQVALLLIAESKAEEIMVTSAEGFCHKDEKRAIIVDSYMKELLHRVVTSQRKHGHSDATSFATLSKKWAQILNPKGVNHH